MRKQESKQRHSRAWLVGYIFCGKHKIQQSLATETLKYRESIAEKKKMCVPKPHGFTMLGFTSVPWSCPTPQPRAQLPPLHVGLRVTEHVRGKRQGLKQKQKWVCLYNLALHTGSRLHSCLWHRHVAVVDHLPLPHKATHDTLPPPS